MKNTNQPPFHVGQRVVATHDGVNGFGTGFKKGQVFTVLGISFCCFWKLDIGLPDLLNHANGWCAKCGKPDLPGVLVSYKYFAPIREVRDHKSIAVPEELLHIKDGDILEPSKILTQ